jgi:hypothetical protein
MQSRRLSLIVVSDLTPQRRTDHARLPCSADRLFRLVLPLLPTYTGFCKSIIRGFTYSNRSLTAKVTFSKSTFEINVEGHGNGAMTKIRCKMSLAQAMQIIAVFKN